MTSSPLSRPPHQKLEEIFDDRIQALTTTNRYYRVCAHRFLSYLHTDFPEVLHLAELRRDPHLLGWLRYLCHQDPPLSNSTRRIYLVGLRRLLHDLASQGHSLQPRLILPEDFPPRPHLSRSLSPKNDRRLQPEVRRTYAPRFRPHLIFEEILDAPIQALATTLRPHTVHIYRVAARRFLSYLQTDFPEVLRLSQLCRDPHLLGWIHCLCHQDPPLSNSTRRTYLLKLQRLLHDLASQGHALQPRLILAEDIPPRPRLQQELRRTLNPRSQPLPHPLFQEIFDARIRTLATTLRPHTIAHYRLATRCFLSYLQTDFPQLLHLSQLRRDPHLCGWFRWLCEKDPPLSNTTRQGYLVRLRRLLQDLASEDNPLQPGLILPEDFPPRPQYLPRALAPEEDQRLQQELRRINDLPSNALLLTRATGMRIGECINLAFDCLRSLGQNQWALHVPLGKLYTERLVPVDEDIRQIVTRMLTLRALDPSSSLQKSAGLLLPRSGSFHTLYGTLSNTLHRAAERIGCSHRITCHQLRHTYATEMLRLGVSLPALMQLLGHKDIRMTLRYLQVTQQDLQHEFHLARRNATHSHLVPRLSLPDRLLSAGSDLPGITRALAATRHLLEMYRRQLGDEKTRLKLQRLDKRLLSVAFELDRLATAAK
jgi:site-specific recombinase XerD